MVVVLDRPVPLVKGLVVALLLAGLVAVGIAMVPLLEHYAFAGVLLTAVVLHGLFYSGLVGTNPLSNVLVLSFALIPVAGVAEQALVGELSVALATGVGIGVLVSAVSHALFPDPPQLPARPPPGAAGAGGGRVDRPSGHADRDAGLRARADRPVVLPGSGDEDGRARTAVRRDRARSAGGELVGATLAGAAIAAGVWTGLSIWPSSGC